MLALAWPWTNGEDSRSPITAARLASSLCAGIGGTAGAAEVEGIRFAYRELRSNPARARAWRPARLGDGRICVFHGYFDNIDELAAQLGGRDLDAAQVYGRAVERWGSEADRRVVGEYCAVVADPQRRRLRLARSPLRAPPLYYFQDDEIAIVGSVPRIFFAAGVPHRLNEVRMSDSAMVNFTDQEASWFEQIFRVPLGSTVEIQCGHERVLDRYYDPLSIPTINIENDAAALERVGELLDEAVHACLKGFRKPGVTLSGGLDSPQVAVRALAKLPRDQRLPTFTFVPETGFDGRVQPGMIGDERPLVEAFAAMHPRLEPHFTENAGYEHDHRWNEFFHLMGGAPSGLCNVYVFHGLFAGAAREGCDLLLVSDWGNYAFSDKGYWGFVEYLATGRWRQLALALRNYTTHDRSLLWRFVAQCLLPLLPNPLWRLARRLVFPHERPAADVIQPFTDAYRVRSGAAQRLKDSGLVFERYQPWNAHHARELLFQNDDGEAAEVYQAFEQMYGVPQRDPMAYRPLVEFCWSLPTRMFMRDGEMRWLAKQLAKGIMPDEQRSNRLNGRWDADWHLRLTRRRADILAELDRLQADPTMAEMLDIPRLRVALEEWPDATEVDWRKYMAREYTVPRALLTARFVKYVEGRNTP